MNREMKVFIYPVGEERRASEYPVNSKNIECHFHTSKAFQLSKETHRDTPTKTSKTQLDSITAFARLETNRPTGAHHLAAHWLSWSLLPALLSSAASQSELLVVPRSLPVSCPLLIELLKKIYFKQLIRFTITDKWIVKVNAPPVTFCVSETVDTPLLAKLTFETLAPWMK